MSRTYAATGIILKGISLGEADRLLTILSPEFGLIRAVAPGARKSKSSLRGRCELFATNQFFLSQGRSLDRILQIETVKIHPGLSQNAGKLAAGQYLIEVLLCLVHEGQPQIELYSLFQEHLQRLAELRAGKSLHAHLAQAVFHLLALGGFAPQVQACALTQKIITPDFSDPRWRVSFSHENGGLVTSNFSRPVVRLTALELTLLQHLGEPELPTLENVLSQNSLRTLRAGHWISLEHLLRDYAQYHLEQTFRAAPLVDSLVEFTF